VFVYIPENDSWTPVASTNFPHNGTAAVGVIDDKIYVAGGNDSSARELECMIPWQTPGRLARRWRLGEITPVAA
jgi:hypothetical protein